MKTIRVGSRESRLAVVQSELVMDAIRAAHPEVGLELVTMKTTGDKILDRTLDKVGGKGLFVKELDAALLDGRVDLTVHSCKDLPMEEDPRIPLAGFSRREDPRDVLVLPQGAEELDPSRPIGCASARRAVQLRALFPGVAVAPVRGNVLTRLRKTGRGTVLPPWCWPPPASSGWGWRSASPGTSRWKSCSPRRVRAFWPSRPGRGRSCPAWTAYWTPTEPTAPGPSVPLSAPWTGAAPLPPRPTPGWRAIP